MGADEDDRRGELVGCTQPTHIYPGFNLFTSPESIHMLICTINRETRIFTITMLQYLTEI